MAHNSGPNPEPPSLADLSDEERREVLKNLDAAGAEGQALAEEIPMPFLDLESENPLRVLLEGQPESVKKVDGPEN